MLALQTIDPYLVPQVFPQQISSSRLLDDVMQDARRPRHHELPILEVGQIADYPILGLGLLVTTPLVRCEESVLIVDVQDLTEKPCDLGFGADRVEAQLETDCEGVVVLTFVWTHGGEATLIFFFGGRTSRKAGIGDLQ